MHIFIDFQLFKLQNTKELNMQVLLCMRTQAFRTKINSIVILNLFALQFISLISINKLGPFYLKMAEFILIFVDGEWEFSSIQLYINLGFNAAVILMFITIILTKDFQYREDILKTLSYIILNFKYIFLIPVGYVNIKPLLSQNVGVYFKIICAINMLVAFLLSAMQLYSNWSIRFIEKDYCNRRQNSIICLFLQFGFVFSTISFGSVVGSIFLIGVSLFRAYQVSITIQYKLIQQSTFFYSCLNIYVCLIVLTATSKLSFIDLTFKLLVGSVVSRYCSKNICNFLNTYYSNNESLYKISKKFLDSEKTEKEGSEAEIENKEKNIQKNLIIISRILLSLQNSTTLELSKINNKQKINSAYDTETEGSESKNANSSMSKKENKNKYPIKTQAESEWEIFWEKFVILLALHEISCQNQKCKCKEATLANQSLVVMEEMRSLMAELQQQQKIAQIRIMGIYVNIQITNKPLKAFYEIIRLQRQQTSVTNFIELQCQIIYTRQCFERIFLINNIQNNNLPLLKILRFEELVESIESKLKLVVETIINFNELFVTSSVKINQVVAQSQKIFETKQKINNRLEDLIVNFPDSSHVNFLVFLFYQYIEVYRSKEKELKIISQEKNLKRRLFSKQDHDIFSPDYGVIYIDLVQQRGKIKKISKNICKLYGHNYEDMLGFNINQFMAHIFAKNHHKFLSNFIEMGKIKILSEKRRLVFAKSKSKFIFPIVVRMKTEHLYDDEFGVSALVRKHETASQYILFNNNGKIQEVTQKIYEKFFQPALKNEVDKTRRLCLIKMIPYLCKILAEPILQSQKVHESLFIFSGYSEMVDKFRMYKQPKKNGSNYGSSGSSFVSSSVQFEQTSQLSLNGALNGTGYFSEVFKNFLNELNIIKLSAITMHYRLSRVKTEQFSILQMQILSIDISERPFVDIIQEYKKVAEALNIYQQHGNIEQNFKKYMQILEQNDVLNYMFNKNIHEMEKMMQSSKNEKSHRKVIKIMNQFEDGNLTESIPASSDNFAKGGKQLNQNQFMQRGGSQRSSVTDQTQSQSKKQMLINAFNSNSVKMNGKLLIFINILVFFLLGLLLSFAIVSIVSIKNLQDQQFVEIINIKLKEIFQFRLAADKLKKIFLLQKNEEYSSELASTVQLLNSQYTKTLISIRNVSSSSQFNQDIEKYINLYDPSLKRMNDITILQLIHELDFRFRTLSDSQNAFYYEQNYQAIHKYFYQATLKSLNRNMNSSKSNFPSTITIVLSIYEFLCLLVGLIWIPVLYFVSKQEKRIISLLSTMNIRELKRTTQRFRLLLDSINSKKLTQTNYILSILTDEKVENAMQMQKQKTTVRSIRLVSENGHSTINSKFVTCFIILFVLFFSIIPFYLFLNVALDSSKYYKALNVISQTSFLADKAPIMANLYLQNINRALNGSSSIQINPQLFPHGQIDYFNLTQYISNISELSQDLIYPNGTNSKFYQDICESVICSEKEKAAPSKFYDKIADLRNAFETLKGKYTQIPLWIQETDQIQKLHWISKLYLFSSHWKQILKDSIEGILYQTQIRLIIISTVGIPLYIVIAIYLQIKILEKLGKILKDAETVHMHFPVQILADNTYLTSYFNDKIKNNK